MREENKRILLKAGFECSREAVHSDEFVKNGMTLYTVPNNSLNVVIHPDTYISEKWNECSAIYHSSSLRAFPKKKNTGVNEIHYGIQVKFDTEDQMMGFLREFDHEADDLKIFGGYEEFGKWIRETRLEQGYTQREFAEKIDCTIEHLSKIENGHRIPSRLLIETVVSTFGYELVLAVKRKDAASYNADNNSEVEYENECRDNVVAAKG